jgi:hypothetical protein
MGFMAADGEDHQDVVSDSLDKCLDCTCLLDVLLSRHFQY